MKRLMAGFAVAVLALSGAAIADVRLMVESFEGEGGAFDPRFNHNIQDMPFSLGEWEVTDVIFLDEENQFPLPSNMLKLRAMIDTVTWNLTGVGSFVDAASVQVQDLEGGFAGTSTALVIFHGEFGDVSRRPADTQQVYTLSVTRDDVIDGSENQSIGAILSIEMHGVWAYFDNVTVDVGHRHCPCDFNADGVYGVQDIYDYLTDWTLGEEGGERPDFNEDGEVSVQDLYDFLSCWSNPATWPLPHCP